MYSWGKAAAAVRGQDNDPWVCAEMVLFNSLIGKGLTDRLIQTFTYMAKEGKVREVPITTLENGQKVARVSAGSLHCARMASAHAMVGRASIRQKVARVSVFVHTIHPCCTERKGGLLRVQSQGGRRSLHDARMALTQAMVGRPTAAVE